ncbi:MAG: flagellar hook-associated protein FlgK [Victivallales bacterium]|nr:flagellar hook-associated protein FlgK [Victivallales bacterium]
MAWNLHTAMNVSTSSLLTKQQQMSIVSTNAANVDNQYYHRRSATVENVDLTGDGAGGAAGVYLSNVTRSYNNVLENCLKSAISGDSYQQEYLARMSQLEELLGPGGDNYLSDAMSDFTTALQNVAANPESVGYRTALLSAGKALASEFNREYDNMATLRDAIAANSTTGSGYLTTEVAEANNLLTQVAKLNKSIQAIESRSTSGQQALELRDRRDELVQKLAAYADISVTENSNGQYTVELNLADGTKTLIDGSTVPQTAASQLQVVMTESPAGFYTPSLSVVDADGTATPVTLNSESGSLRALLDTREYVVSGMSDLYDFAAAVADQINALQNNPDTYDLNNNSNQGNFFSAPASQPAKGSILALDDYITGNPRLIAASGQSGQSGNGEAAAAMWDALHADGRFQGESLVDYADRLLANAAQEVADAATSAETTAGVVEMYTAAVSEQSGVSMDEEMVNMLELQRAYQASSKMISTIDEMIQTALGMV